MEHIVSQALDSPDGYKIWIGLWTPEARESLTTHVTQISPKLKPGPIHAQILAVMQRCSQAADLLWHTRSQLPLHTEFLHHLRTVHPSLLHRYRGTRPRPTRAKIRHSNTLVVAPSRNSRSTARRPRRRKAGPVRNLTSDSLSGPPNRTPSILRPPRLSHKRPVVVLPKITDFFTRIQPLPTTGIG